MQRETGFSSTSPGPGGRDPNLAVFLGKFSRTGFISGQLIDNVKYLFLHCLEHAPWLDCRFVTQDGRHWRALRDNRGLPVLRFPDPECVEAMARAGMVVADDLWWKVPSSPMRPLLDGARTLQLWHGIPLKKIGFPEMESGPSPSKEKRDVIEAGYAGYDAVLSTSPFMTERCFRPSFRAAEFVEAGYPRNDVLLREPGERDLINVDMAVYDAVREKREQGWRFVFYAPTFRDSGVDPFAGGVLRPAELEAFARRHKIGFVVKLHPYVPGVEGLEGRQGLFMPVPFMDPYPLLAQADMLVTDYSSIYFDYLLLDRPLAFLAWDLEHYMVRDRELFFDYGEATPGPKCRTQEELLDAVLDALERGVDPMAEERRAWRDRAFSHADGGAARRLERFMLERFGP